MNNNQTSALRIILLSTAIFLLPSAYAHSNLSAPKDFRTFSSDETLSSVGIHDFTGLPLTQNGWTDFEAMIATGYQNARVIFVSSTEGNDNTAQLYDKSKIIFDKNGMFQANGPVIAYKTITAAYAKIRTGYPDILLLKRGDQWTEGFSNTSAGRPKSGSSPTTRHIIASYGVGNRPALVSDALIPFDIYAAKNLIVSGIGMSTSDWNLGVRAIGITGTSKDILFEDVKSDQHYKNLISDTGVENIAIRRCVFTEYSAHDGIFYVNKVNNMLFEENIFYKPKDPGVSTFGRIFYFNPGDGINLNQLQNLIVRGNILYSSERGGVDGRAGGTFDNNLHVQSAFTLAANGGSGGSLVSGSITNSVFTQGTLNNGLGSFLTIKNGDGVIVKGNIWTDPSGITGKGAPISISGDPNYLLYVAKNIEISENIFYGWYGGYDNIGIYLAVIEDVSNVRIHDNDFQLTNGSTSIINVPIDIIENVKFSNNRYYSTSLESTWFRTNSLDYNLSGWSGVSGDTGSQALKIPYPHPERTLNTYNTTLGGNASTEEFIMETLNQSRHNWRPKYTAKSVNNYIREGFGKSAVE